MGGPKELQAHVNPGQHRKATSKGCNHNAWLGRSTPRPWIPKSKSVSIRLVLLLISQCVPPSPIWRCSAVVHDGSDIQADLDLGVKGEVSEFTDGTQHFWQDWL